MKLAELFRKFGRGVLALGGLVVALFSKAARLPRYLADSLSRAFCKFRNCFKVKRDEFWSHFWHDLLVGVLIEAVVTQVSGFPLVADIQNVALDAVMRLSAHHGEKSSERPVQVFIDVDERTWRSPAWSGGEPRAVPWERVADLIAQAAAWQPRYVLVDFQTDGAQDAEQDAFLARMEGVLEQHPESRLLFVRSFRRPLVRLGAPGIRPSYAVDTLMARYPKQVFAVAPNFELSGGQVLRRWRLWESACYPLPGQHGEGVWAVVPSPQMMIKALEAKADIPWKLRFAEDAKGVTFAKDDATEDDRRCVVDASDAQETRNSARLADWEAGKWVQEHLGTCYQQGFFREADCNSTERPRPELAQGNNLTSGDRHLSSRVLFRQSDLAGRHEEARLQGKLQLPPSYGAHFQRISAADLLNEATVSMEGESTDIAQKKLFTAAAQGQVSVAVIGASYDASHDHHMTPLGKMPGSLVLVNAVESMQTVGVLQELDGVAKWTVTALSLLASALLAALFFSSCLSAFPELFFTIVLCLSTLLALGPLSMWLLKRGVWLDIAAPFIGIYLERRLEDFLKRFKETFMKRPQTSDNAQPQPQENE